MVQTIIIVEKSATLKTLTVKDYKEAELYKKCGFKNHEGFSLQVEWPVKLDGQKYVVQMYGKLEGKANMENKYDFPPPVDKKLYFGACCLVGFIRDESNERSPIHLTLDLWNRIYEKLFGGFEDLTTTCNEDDDEEDELDNIPKSMKTKKGGYLKDGFVVDSSDPEDIDVFDSDEDDDDDDDEPTGTSSEELEDELILEDVGSELSEESYDYSDTEK
jgi:hypothetical protein